MESWFYELLEFDKNYIGNHWETKEISLTEYPLLILFNNHVNVDDIEEQQLKECKHQWKAQ